MIFDLRGKRRRAVQVVYATLAVTMGAGLVLFGIGGDVSGGLLDGLGIGGHGGAGGHGGGRGVDFEERADDLEESLAKRPRDERLLLQLAGARYQAGLGAAESGGGHGGPPTLNEEALEQLEGTASAWERYLDLRPVRPSAGTARIAVQAYLGLGDAAGAAAAQEIVAAATPSAGALGSLALYRYASGDLRRGDAAAEQAVEGVPAAQRAQFRRRLSAVRRTARENGAAITQPGPGNLPGGHGP